MNCRLAQWNSSWEEPGECVQRHSPVLGSGTGMASSLTRNVAQPKVNQLHRRFLVREMPAVLGDFAELEIDRLDRYLECSNQRL
jgi:hypothetical protein